MIALAQIGELPMMILRKLMAAVAFFALAAVEGTSGTHNICSNARSDSWI